MKGRSQILQLLFVHKNSDVWPDPVLFSNNSKSDTGIATIQRRQHIGECRAIDLHVTPVCCVGSQCSGYMHRHRPISAASTEKISRECLAMPAHVAPSLRLAQISPPVVPR